MPRLVSDRASLSAVSIKGHQPGPGARWRGREGPAGHRGTAGEQSRFPGISGGFGDSHPAEGCEGRCGAPEKQSGRGASWARVGEIKQGQFRHTWGFFPH